MCELYIASSLNNFRVTIFYRKWTCFYKVIIDVLKPCLPYCIINRDKLDCDKIWFWSQCFVELTHLGYCTVFSNDLCHL